MAKKNKGKKFTILTAVAAFVWAFLFLVPPEFAINRFYEKYTPAERNYLASLRYRYSGTQRTLSEVQTRIVIKNALHFLSSQNSTSKLLNSDDVVELLFGTACTETQLSPRFQDSGGYAIGLFQIEYATFKDLWKRSIPKNNPDLYVAIQKKYSRFSSGEIFFEDLQINDELCAVFARMKYAQIKSPIPPASDAKAQASYYKKYYNTPLGKASADAYLERTKSVKEKSQNSKTKI